MALTNRDALVLARLQDFFKSCPKNYHFDLFDNVVTPLHTELALLEPFLNGYQFSNEAVAQVRSEIAMPEAYRLLWYAARMAIHGARTGHPKYLEESFWAMCLDEDDVDYGDVLTALAVIEDCADRLGIDLEDVVEEWIDIASPDRKQTIQQGFLAREEGERTVETMGYKAIDSGDDGLMYVKNV